MAIKGRAQKTLTKIFDGSGVFSIIITNENTSIPISNQGLALNYSATPTDAYVYSGTSILTPVKSNPDAGQYTISVEGENITPGIVSMNGNHASVGNASNMVSNKESYSISITASGKDFLGNPFTSQKKQVITPLKRGDDATSYWLNVTSSVITKDVKNNMTPSDVTISSVAQSGFSDPREYNAIFKVYYKTGIDFPSTPDYTSANPESSHKVTPNTNVNDIKIEMYDEGNSNLLDVQTIPIISQANGVISTNIVYTVTSSAVQPNDSANWSNTMPTVGKGQYLWTKTTFYYTDGSNAVAYSLGSVGKDGSSAALLTLISDSQVFTFKSDNTTPSPASQVINFVANLQNVTGTATFTATPYLGTAAGTPIVLGGTGNARTLTVDQFGKSYDSVVVKATLGSLSDTETIHKLKDGTDGTDGKNGSTGVQGPKGVDGKSSFIHVAYANSADGSKDFSTSVFSGKSYIGIYTDEVETDSTDYKQYTWSLSKGTDGKDGSDGLPGPKGADGISTYVHFAYANSADGSKDFSTTDYAGRSYIGNLTDTTVADSTDYKKYTWSLVKGADGKDSISGWLTNEAITVQADSNGNVPNFSNAKGTFVVYNGTSPVTGLSITQANATGMSVSISGMDYSVTGMSQDSGYVDLIATTAGVTITKRLTLAKSKAGATGENGTSVVNSTTPPKNPDEGQWWNDLSVTPNILKVYQKGQWIPYLIDAINLKANSITTDKLAASVLMASNVTYTNSNGTTTNLQTFDFDGIKTLLTDNNGNTYENMETAVGSTTIVKNMQNKVNSMGQVNQLVNTEFTPDFSGWYAGTPANSGKLNNSTPLDNDSSWYFSSEKRNGSNAITNTYGSGASGIHTDYIPIGSNVTAILSAEAKSSSDYNGTVTCSLRFYFYDSNKNYISFLNKDSGKASAWTRYYASGVSPSNAAYVSVAIVTNGQVGSSSYSQPMLVFASTIGDYAPGQYNNNNRMLQIEARADSYDISIKTAQSTADTANSSINNLSIGGRNYLYGTSSSTSITGANTTNQSRNFYKITLNSLDALYNEFKNLSDYYTLSYDWKYTGTNPSGTFYPQWNMAPWGLGSSRVTTLSSSNTSGTCVFIDKIPTTWSGVTGLPFLNFRLDNVPTSGTITISNIRLMPGNKNYPWTMAPEDNSFDGRNLIQNSQSLNFTVGGNTSTTVTKTSYDANTNMWHVVAPKGGSTNAGIFFSESVIKNGYPWTISYDIKGTGVVSSIGTRIEGSTTVSDMNGSIGTDWSRVSTSGYSVQDSRALVIYFDASQQALDVYIKLPKLEIGTKVTPWSIAPEDLANGIANAQSSADTANLGVAQSLSSNLVVNSEFDNSTGSYTGWHMTSPWGATVTSQISKNGNKTKADSGSYLYPSPSQMMVHDITNNGDWIYSDPIPVGASQPISGSLTNANPSGATTNVGLALYVYAYDANKNRISAIVGSNLTSVHGNWVVNSFENKLTPANTAYISFCFGWNNGKGYFGQPMLQANSKYTGYIPGTPNSNLAIANAQASATSAQTSADAANNNLANASKSGIRYLRFRSEGNTDNASTHFSEISVYSVNGANLLSNKSAVMVGGATTSSSLTAATDGNYSTYLDLPNITNGEKYAMYDLGSVRYDVENISVAMYSSTRTYYNVTVQTSVDNVTWSTIYRGNITPNQLINGVVGTNISFGMDTSTVLKLTADNYTLGIDANGNLVSGITGNTQQVTLKGNVIHLDGNTIMDQDFFSLWNGQYGSTKIDSTGMEVATGKAKTKFTNGNMQLISDLGENIGFIGRQVDSVYNNLDFLTFGLNGWHTTYPGDEHYDSNGTNTDQYYGGDGIIFGISNADGGYSPLLQWNSQLAANYRSAKSGWLFTQPIVGATTFYPNDMSSDSDGLTLRKMTLDGVAYPTYSSTSSDGAAGLAVGIGTSNLYAGSKRILQANSNGYMYYMTKMTSSSGVNLKMASDGAIVAQSSATKYKSDIEYELDTSHGDKLLTIDPATWSDSVQKEQIEEYNRTGKEPDYAMNKDGDRFYGLIAEDLVKAGLEDLVVRDTKTGSVEGIQYEKIGIALIPILREQRNQINELRVEIERLKENNNE